jgi:two-component system, OmpR family, response regulator MprA
MHALVDRTTILVVEDSRNLVSLLSRVLTEHGYFVRSAADGDAGIASAVEHPPDLMILDVGLPRRSGLEVVNELRRRGLAIPVLILTARNRVSDRILGFDAGADDYLPKPFDTDELVARVRALLRRASLHTRATRIRVGDLVLDPLTRDVKRGDRRLSLTQREFTLLEYFMRNADKTLSRMAIVEQVWRRDATDVEETNIVDVYVAHLRRKLDDEAEPAMLLTVRGAGYVLRAPKPAKAKPSRVKGRT